MKENELIKKLFQDLFDGSPWIDVTLMGTLKNLSAEKAIAKPAQFSNSIWQIVNHIIQWRLNVLQRLEGKVMATPAHNYFEEISNGSQTAWELTLEELRLSQEKWINFLDKLDPDTFSKIYTPNGMNYYEHIHGILQHDAYHLGQLALLVKYY